MRSVLAIQSSGVGNCGNLFAMLRSCTMLAPLVCLAARARAPMFIPAWPGVGFD